MTAPKIIAVTNQKGGVGKTTTCINLAASLVASGRKILLLDFDPQGNATMGSGVDKNEVEHTGYDLLIEGVPFEEVRLPTAPAGYDLIPSNGELTAAEVELFRFEHRERRLADRLRGSVGGYDYLLIDCPPSLSMLTINALTVADSVLIPVQCEYYALEGLTALLDTIRRVMGAANPQLAIEGLLRTMFDGRNSLSQDVSRQLEEHFGDLVFRTLIPRNVRLAEAPSYGMPAYHYDRRSTGARAYLALAGEFLRRQAALAGAGEVLSTMPGDATAAGSAMVRVSDEDAE